MQTKERATVSLTAETLRVARELIPDLNLSALFDEALAQRVRTAHEEKTAASYAQFPSDYDDDIDWGTAYGIAPEEQARALAARRAWQGDD